MGGVAWSKTRERGGDREEGRARRAAARLRAKGQGAKRDFLGGVFRQIREREARVSVSGSHRGRLDQPLSQVRAALERGFRAFVASRRIDVGRFPSEPPFELLAAAAYRSVTLARGRFESEAVDDLDLAAAMIDDARRFQRAGDQRHGGSARAGEAREIRV